MQKRANELKVGDVMVSRIGREATIMEVLPTHHYVALVCHHTRPDGSVAVLEYNPRNTDTVEVKEKS